MSRISRRHELQSIGRRSILTGLAATAAATVVSGRARAQAGNYPSRPITIVNNSDVAATAAALLREPNFAGHTVQYLLGQRTLDFRAVAPILGAAIGKPETVYRQVLAQEERASMMARGFSASFLDLREELSNSFSAGVLQATVVRDATNTTSTSIEKFARTVFAAAVAKQM